MRKTMCNTLHLDIVRINAYTKFGKILSIVLKILSGNEIMTDRRNDGRPKSSIVPLFQIRAIIKHTPY